MMDEALVRRLGLTYTPKMTAQFDIAKEYLRAQRIHDAVDTHPVLGLEILRMVLRNSRLGYEDDLWLACDLFYHEVWEEICADAENFLAHTRKYPKIIMLPEWQILVTLAHDVMENEWVWGYSRTLGCPDLVGDYDSFYTNLDSLIRYLGRNKFHLDFSRRAFAKKLLQQKR